MPRVKGRARNENESNNQKFVLRLDSSSNLMDDKVNELIAKRETVKIFEITSPTKKEDMDILTSNNNNNNNVEHYFTTFMTNLLARHQKQDKQQNFPSLREFRFSRFNRHLSIDTNEIDLILQFKNQVMALPSNNNMNDIIHLHFQETSLSTAAVKRLMKEWNQHYDQQEQQQQQQIMHNSPLLLSFKLTIHGCPWLEYAGMLLSGHGRPTSSVDNNNNSNYSNVVYDMTVRVNEIQVNLQKTKQFTSAFTALFFENERNNNVPNLCFKKIIFGQVSISPDAIEYLHTFLQQEENCQALLEKNNTDDNHDMNNNNNNETTKVVIPYVDYSICRLIANETNNNNNNNEDDETNHNVSLQDPTGLFSFDEHSIGFNQFQSIMNQAKANVFAHIFQLFMQQKRQYPEELQVLFIRDCQVTTDAITQLMMPFTKTQTNNNNNNNSTAQIDNKIHKQYLVSSVTFENCIIHISDNNEKETKEKSSNDNDNNNQAFAIPTMSWNCNDHALLISGCDEDLEQSIISLRKVVAQFELLRNNVTEWIMDHEMPDNAYLELSQCLLLDSTTTETNPTTTTTTLLFSSPVIIKKLKFLGAELNNDIFQQHFIPALKSNTTLTCLTLGEETEVTNVALKTLLNQVLLKNNMTLQSVILENANEKFEKSTIELVTYYAALNRAGRKVLLSKNNNVDNNYNYLSPWQLSRFMERGNNHPSVLYWIMKRYLHCLFFIDNQNNKKRKRQENVN